MAEAIVMALLTGAFIGIAGYMIGDKAGFHRGRRIGWTERDRVLRIDPNYPILFDAAKAESKAHVRLLKEGERHAS